MSFSQTNPPPVQNPGPGTVTAAGFPVRIAAMTYDALALAAILIVAAFPVVLWAGGPPRHFAAHLAFQAYLLAVVFAFFGWFWTHGGQTLGMRAWRLKLIAANGTPPDVRMAALRFAAAGLSWAALGAGFLWALVDREGLAWHDRLSGTRLVRLPTPQQ